MRPSDPSTLGTARVVCGTGGTRASCQVDGTTRSASSAEAEKTTLAFRWLRNVSRTSSVDTLPSRDQTAFGGGPFRKASWPGNSTASGPPRCRDRFWSSSSPTPGWRAAAHASPRTRSQLERALPSTPENQRRSHRWSCPTPDNPRRHKPLSASQQNTACRFAPQDESQSPTSGPLSSGYSSMQPVESLGPTCPVGSNCGGGPAGGGGA